jgi:hypothetical protein
MRSVLIFYCKKGTGMQTIEQQRAFYRDLVLTILAYHGKLHGCKSMKECFHNELVLTEGRGVLKEIDQVFRKEVGDYEEFNEDRITEMLDQINQLGQAEEIDQLVDDPRRKLMREGLLTGALKRFIHSGIPASYVIRGIAAALHYDRTDDEGAVYVQTIIQQKGVKEAAAELCSLTVDEQTLLMQIVRAYHRLPLELEWQEKARRAYELGFENEKVYKGCGQSVFAAVGDVLGIYDETTFRAATGLSGGLGLIGDAHCSALTGTCLIAGILYPRRREFFNGDRESKYQCYDIVQKMHQHYLDQYGSVKCYEVHRNLMGRPFNLRDDVDKVEFEKAGAHEFACTGVVGRASQWVVELIGEKKIEEELNKIFEV